MYTAWDRLWVALRWRRMNSHDDGWSYLGQCSPLPEAWIPCFRSSEATKRPYRGNPQYVPYPNTLTVQSEVNRTEWHWIGYRNLWKASLSRLLWNIGLNDEKYAYNEVESSENCSHLEEGWALWDLTWWTATDYSWSWTGDMIPEIRWHENVSLRQHESSRDSVYPGRNGLVIECSPISPIISEGELNLIWLHTSNLGITVSSNAGKLTFDLTGDQSLNAWDAKYVISYGALRTQGLHWGSK